MAISTVREEKTYALTAGELWQLFAFGILTTGFFSLAGWFFDSSYGIYKDMAFNANLSSEIVNHWEGIRSDFVKYGWLSLVASFVFACFGGAKILEIMHTTKFEEE